MRSHITNAKMMLPLKRPIRMLFQHKERPRAAQSPPSTQAMRASRLLVVIPDRPSPVQPHRSDAQHSHESEALAACSCSPLIECRGLGEHSGILCRHLNATAAAD